MIESSYEVTDAAPDEAPADPQSHRPIDKSGEKN